MKTILEIINETVEFYSTDVSRRALLLDNACEYITPNGNKCAVGRCFDENVMTDKIYRAIKTCSVDAISYRVPNNLTFEDLLKEEYKGHSIEFWYALQRLHDHGFNWNENGMSAFGKNELKELIQNYGE